MNHYSLTAEERAEQGLLTIAECADALGVNYRLMQAAATRRTVAVVKIDGSLYISKEECERIRSNPSIITRTPPEGYITVQEAEKQTGVPDYKIYQLIEKKIVDVAPGYKARYIPVDELEIIKNYKKYTRAERDKQSEGLLNISQVAEILKKSNCTVNSYARRGLLPAKKIGNTWYFKKEDVEAFTPPTPGTRYHSAETTPVKANNAVFKDAAKKEAERWKKERDSAIFSLKKGRIDSLLERWGLPIEDDPLEYWGLVYTYIYAIADDPPCICWGGAKKWLDEHCFLDEKGNVDENTKRDSERVFGD